MEIVKKTIKVGNSAGVLLPKKWLNTQVKVILEPSNIEKDVLEILSDEGLLEGVLGAYVVGSYSRGEETIESDVDVLVLTSDINKKISKGKYEIICISKKETEKQLGENALPLLAMIKEAKTIINKDLIEEYKNNLLTKKNLKWHIETTKSALNIVNKDIEIAGQTNQRVSDASAYSLILRLRTVYIIDCIRKKKLWTKKEFLKFVKKISGSHKAYERYLKIKNKNTMDYVLKKSEAEKLSAHIKNQIKDIEKWLKEKRD